MLVNIILKNVLLGLSLSVITIIAGCSQVESDKTKTQTTQSELTTIGIGYQKYGILTLLKARGTLDEMLKANNIAVKWIEFPAGPQLLEGLNVGSVVVGETGDAPPIFGQVANADLRYFANQQPAPKGGGFGCQKGFANYKIK